MVYCVVFWTFISSGLEYDAVSTTKYHGLIENIEHFSKMCHFFLVKLTLTILIVPPFILTYVSYFILGLGDKSFMDIPVKYVVFTLLFLKL